MDAESTIAEGVKKYGPLGAARRSSLMTQGELAKRLGCSTPVIVELEKHPEGITLEQLGKWYQLVRVDGKAIIEQYVNDFFVA